MPEFYSLDSDMGFEIGEDLLDDLEVMEEPAFAEDFPYYDEDYAHAGDELTVEEDEVQFDLVPGSDEQYVEVDEADDDSVEVRETTWQDDGDHGKFLPYIKFKITQIPRHSGKSIPGCERALAFLKDCDNEISKAMRSDLKGEIDEDEVEKIRQQIHGMMDRLDKHIDRLRKKAGVQHVRFVSDDNFGGLEKTAGTPVLNVYMTPFERACVSTMINSKVAAGKNIEETFEHLKNKYDFSPREVMAMVQLLSDHGYPVYRDRAHIDENVDPSSDHDGEWPTQYYA